MPLGPFHLYNFNFTGANNTIVVTARSFDVGPTFAPRNVVISLKKYSRFVKEISFFML